MITGSSLLEQEIRSDIEERKELMSRLRLLCSRYNFEEDDEKLFLGYSIPMVYAIWEGFIQTAFQTYIRELNNLGLTIETVCKPILVFHLETKFKQFKQYPEKAERKISFFDQLSQFYASRVININPIVNTESNVGFNVLNRILAEFNLETIPEYPEPRYSLPVELDRFLLKIRNNLAHGQNSIVVNRDDLQRAITLVDKLMELVCERIISGFMNRTYLN